eukprot:TRINITY_DN56567_c0_g1_i1.p1 TRINITY_DN56567_c0_g1~~TRINITY_DN56567_c0_g1_i1.p1  ORF type:complete len:410 (-),score=84.23 TRINITY_DN56567_c0_g1_i1:159-1388(-)
MMRCIVTLAAVVPCTVAIHKKHVNRKYSMDNLQQQALELSVQMRQYALLAGSDLGAEPQPPLPQQLLAVDHASAVSLAETTTLDENGYSAVAGLRSQEAMTIFAERVLAQDGLRVKDKAMLSRVVPFYDGECMQQSMAALRHELQQAKSPRGCHAAWVEQDGTKKPMALLTQAAQPHVSVSPLPGAEAPLNQTGYRAVVELRDNDEMKTFIRRVAKDEGLQIMNEGALSGFARYYSGVCARQSYAALVKELHNVQRVVGTTSISYTLKEAVDMDDFKARISAALGLNPEEISVALGSPEPAAQEAVETPPAADDTSASSPPPAVLETPPAAPDTSASDPVASNKLVGNVVVTVKSSSDASKIKSLLSQLASEPSLAMALNGAPETKVTTVTQPESCGGGWVTHKSIAGI